MKIKKQLLVPRAQSIGEYAVMIALVIAAVVAMQVYVQRALQARYRAATRYLIINQMRNTTHNADIPTQYEPYYTQSDFTVTQRSNLQEKLSASSGEIKRWTNEIVEKKGKQAVLPGSEAD